MIHGEPQYQEYKADTIPVFQNEKIHAKVIAGEVKFSAFATVAKMASKVQLPRGLLLLNKNVFGPAYFIDFTINAGTVYEHIIPKLIFPYFAQGMEQYDNLPPYLLPNLSPYLPPFLKLSIPPEYATKVR